MCVLAGEVVRRLGMFDAAKSRLETARNLLGPRDAWHRKILEIALDLIRQRDRAPHELSEFGL